MRVCPEGAITEGTRDIGVVEMGMAAKIAFIHGKLRIGEAMSPPLMRQVKGGVPNHGINFFDVPPGTSCPAVTAVQDADFVVLVTEPTPFGLSDLGLAIGMVRQLDIRHGVVVNRHEDDNASAREFCKKQGVEILAEIPDDRRVAEAYSRGELASVAVPGYSANFARLLKIIRRRIKKGHGA
jgi:MinD superfamily P-loop ATPase